MRDEQRQRLREAKRKNRQRRRDRYKNAKTYHGAIRAAIRRYNTWLTEPVIFSPAEGIIDYKKAVKRLQWAQPNANAPVLYIFSQNDCVGRLPGLNWYQEKTEEGADEGRTAAAAKP
jgi:hypothetical protein